MIDHSICQGRFITEFGCGCNKAKFASSATSSRRVTVYEVQVNGVTEGEYFSLPEARAEAVKVGGRVKVSSKVVSV